MLLFYDYELHRLVGQLINLLFSMLNHRNMTFWILNENKNENILSLLYNLKIVNIFVYNFIEQI